MCGIVGIFQKNGKSVPFELIKKMTDTIKHRGPTSEGFYINGAVGLGNRRLAIIDINGGFQPISNEDGHIWITFNGEIYNYKNIRSHLIFKGHQVKTFSDTETVVHAYEEWGEDCVNHFRGMFAFCIVDWNKRQLFIARDHFGIKPLYFLELPGLFAFASEIQALRQIPDLKLRLDLQAVDQYLSLQYIPAPKTIFAQMQKLYPAHSLIVSMDGGDLLLHQYWQLNFASDNRVKEQEWLELIDNTLHDSIQAHLVADVPFGAFLSGGVDSSAVVAYMSQILRYPVQTFSIGFYESEFNELEYAKEVADKWNAHHNIQIVKPDALEILPALVKHYGEPFGDSSAIATYYVAQMAGNQVPMVLSGDGGDEFFAGYGTYSAFLHWMYRSGKYDWKRMLYPFASMILPNQYPHLRNPLDIWLHLISYLKPYDRSLLWHDDFQSVLAQPVTVFTNEYSKSKSYPLCSMVQYLDVKTYLPYDILTKVDIASMMSSLEVRTPFIDIQVAEAIAFIPPSLLMAPNKEGEWEGKLLLKKLLSKFYPAEFLNRPKMGFAIPITRWFAPGGSLYKYTNDRLTGNNSYLKELFRRKGIERILRENNPGKIWLLLFLDEWLRQNLREVSW